MGTASMTNVKLTILDNSVFVIIDNVIKNIKRQFGQDL